MLLIIILIGTLVVYFVVSKSTSGTKNPCKSNEEIINGKCVTKCPNDGPRCPSKTGQCMNIGDHCDSKGTICDDYHYCTPKNSPALCCPSNQHCDKTDINDQKCVTCPNKTCGGICCKNSTDACGNDGNSCCDPSKIGRSQFGKINDKCCEEELCDGICCDLTNGYICGVDTDNTKKCMIQCPNIKDINNDIYKCNGKSPDIQNITPIKCKDNQFCVLDCDNNTFTCEDNNMCWDNVTYDPALLTYKDEKGNVDGYKLNQKSVNLASDGGKTQGKWLTNTSNDLSSKIVVELSSQFSQKNCDKQSCINKIDQKGLSVAKYKTPALSNTDIKDGVCTAKLDTSVLLSLTDAINICGDLDSNYSKANEGRCCKNQNGYTGQICDIGDTCALIGSNYQCIDPNTYCGKNGKWNNSNVKCDCNPGFKGDTCQDIQRWDEVYNYDWILKYVNTVSNNVFSYNNASPSCAQTVVKNWETFMIIFVNGDTNFLNTGSGNHWINRATVVEYFSTFRGYCYSGSGNSYDEIYNIINDNNINFVYQYGYIGTTHSDIVCDGVARLHWCNPTDAYSVCLDTSSGFLKGVYWNFYPFWYSDERNPDNHLGINVLIVSQHEYMDKTKVSSNFSGSVIGIPANDCAKVSENCPLS